METRYSPRIAGDQKLGFGTIRQRLSWRLTSQYTIVDDENSPLFRLVDRNAWCIFCPIRAFMKPSFDVMRVSSKMSYIIGRIEQQKVPQKFLDFAQKREDVEENFGDYTDPRWYCIGFERQLSMNARVNFIGAHLFLVSESHVRSSFLVIII